MRKIKFENEEYYHLYNRGVEKRNIVIDKYDSQRFLQSLKEFNVISPIGSIFEKTYRKKRQGTNSNFGNLVSKINNMPKLVEVVCYCLNPNHFHLLVRQLANKGIEKFMHKLGLGYAKYFNNRYERTGSLYEGTFKAKHIASNDYLLYLSAYINLNDRIHGLDVNARKLVRSSWDTFIGRNKGQEILCNPDVVIGQFDDGHDYEKYCLDTLPTLLENKANAKELQELILET